MATLNRKFERRVTLMARMSDGPILIDPASEEYKLIFDTQHGPPTMKVDRRALKKGGKGRGGGGGGGGGSGRASSSSSSSRGGGGGHSGGGGGGRNNSGRGSGSSSSKKSQHNKRQHSPSAAHDRRISHTSGRYYAKRTYRGVTDVSRRGNVFKAAIFKSGSTHYLGRYETITDAARAYDAAAVFLFGDRATLNFPNDWTDERRTSHVSSASPSLNGDALRDFIGATVRESAAIGGDEE